MSKFKKITELFLTFLKIGAFTFGGGYAMVPLFSKEFVENKKWITDNDILEMIAIAETTPGPIAVNMATFIGYQIGGVLGSAAATLGVVLPSFVIIIIIALFYDKFIAIKAVKYAFYGIKAGVLALVLKGFTKMYKAVDKNVFAYIIMACAFIAVAFFGVNAIIVSIAAAVLGVAFVLIGKKGASK